LTLWILLTPQIPLIQNEIEVFCCPRWRLGQACYRLPAEDPFWESTSLHFSNSTMDVNVFVCVRIRPLLADELSAAAQRCLTSVPGAPTASPASFPRVEMGPKHAFSFDAVFDEHATQHEVFSSAVAPLVEGLFSGYHGTVLAYGQTGSGKTFTMGSSVQTGTPLQKYDIEQFVLASLVMPARKSSLFAYSL
jgi:hypothetical protein